MFEELDLGKDLRWAFGFVEKTLTKSDFIKDNFSSPAAKELLEELVDRVAHYVSDPDGLFGESKALALILSEGEEHIPQDIQDVYKGVASKSASLRLTLNAFRAAAEQIAVQNLKASVEHHNLLERQDNLVEHEASKETLGKFIETFGSFKKADSLFNFFNEAMGILHHTEPTIFTRDDSFILDHFTRYIDAELSRK